MGSIGVSLETWPATRSVNLMKRTTKTRLMLIGATIVFLFQVGSAQAAKLRYIRIGEHDTFTRIVFEFPDSVRFKDPVVKGRGRLSVVFLDTTTVLPKKIPCETTKRVDGIEFVQQGSHLTAHVALAFPYFKLKSFSLTKPQRVVVDVYRTSAPPKGFGVQGPVREKPSVKPERPPAKKELTTKPESPAAKEVREHLEKSAARAPEEDLGKMPQEVAAQPPAQPQEPAIETVPEPIRVAPAETQSPPSLPQQGRLQTYLLTALIGLSVIIVVLLALIFVKKIRRAKPRQSGGAIDETVEADESVEEIDEKIRQQFMEFDQP